MKLLLLLFAFAGVTQPAPPAGPREVARKPCDPKTDPGCGNFRPGGQLVPVADPISTPNAARLARKPCDPKHDPGCNN